MEKVVINNDLVVITSKYMDNNSYIIYKDKEAIIIDPSFNGQDIIETIPNDTKVVGILLTHAHFDHCFDVAKILSKWDCPVYIHEADKSTYTTYRYDDLAELKVNDFSKNIKYFNTKKLNIGSFELSVILTPGHSSGSVAYIYKDFFFTGDTLFYNSYGRTDLGNSSPNDIIKSINLLWNQFKDDDLILPGHGKWSKFKEIKNNNWMAKELIKK